jgi:putative transposase
MLERLFKEVKRRTRVVGVFPNETSAATLATEIALRSSEEWALRRYLTMDALEITEKPNPPLRRYLTMDALEITEKPNPHHSRH